MILQWFASSLSVHSLVWLWLNFFYLFTIIESFIIHKYVIYFRKPGSTTGVEHEDDIGNGWNDNETSNEISESPRDSEVERYNSTIHAEPIPGQTYSRFVTNLRLSVMYAVVVIVKGYR